MPSLYQKLRRAERINLPDFAESRQWELLENQAGQEGLLREIINGQESLPECISQSISLRYGSLSEGARATVREKEVELKEIVGDTNPRNRMLRTIGASGLIGLGLDYAINQVILKQPLPQDARMMTMGGCLFIGKFLCGSLSDFKNKLNKRAQYIMGVIDCLYGTS